MARLSAEKLEQFREKRAANAAWRTQFLADLVWMFVPRGKPKPWEEVAREAVAHYENGSNWAANDPMLESLSDSFVSVSGIMGRRGDIRQVLAQEGAFIIPVRGQGIRRPASREEIKRSFDTESCVIEGMTERYNFLAEEAKNKKGLNIPTFRMQLLPPKAGDNE